MFPQELVSNEKWITKLTFYNVILLRFECFSVHSKFDKNLIKYAFWSFVFGNVM